mgnify:CR=1 FL=1
MSGLLAYSGIATKVKSMQSKLLSEDKLREMAALENVPEALEYLKRQPAYEDLFSDVDDQSFHRSAIEQRLLLSKYRDFTKLYRFSRVSQRKFLDLYFLHYEIAILKRCLRCVLDHRNPDLDLSLFQEFFEKHSHLNLMALSSAQTIQDFVSNLGGTVFYDLLADLAETPGTTLFDYELKMDLLYFKTMWKQASYLSKKEAEILTQCFGSKLDLLNIQWIYRSKKYYQLSTADIYALLIPMNYKLKKEETTSLVEAVSYEETRSIFRKTYYGRKYSHISAQNIEEFYNYMLRTTLEKEARKDPYSVAVLYSYLYHKEHEVNRLTIAIECVRYGIPAEEAIRYIRNN